MKPSTTSFSLCKQPWSIIVTLIIIVLAFLYVDKPLATYMHQIDARVSMPYWNYITLLGKWKPYALLFLLAGLYYHFFSKNSHYENEAWYLFCCVVSANLLNTGLKILFGRARPELLFLQNEYGFYWWQFKDQFWSMPSGHAITASTLAAALGVLRPKYYLLFLLLALLIVISRVVLYYHYLSDVIVGFYLAILVVGLITSYFHKYHWLKQ